MFKDSHSVEIMCLTCASSNQAGELLRISPHFINLGDYFGLGLRLGKRLKARSNLRQIIGKRRSLKHLHGLAARISRELTLYIQDERRLSNDGQDKLLINALTISY